VPHKQGSPAGSNALPSFVVGVSRNVTLGSALAMQAIVESNSSRRGKGLHMHRHVSRVSGAVRPATVAGGIHQWRCESRLA
jgi:hypothetical protein